MPSQLESKNVVDETENVVRISPKLNIFGFIFNLIVAALWAYIIYLLYSQVQQSNHMSKLFENICLSICDYILFLLHAFLCFFPKLSARPPKISFMFLTSLAVLIQFFIILLSNLKYEDFYANYLWSVCLILGSVSLCILLTDVSELKDSFLLYFKPWVIEE